RRRFGFAGLGVGPGEREGSGRRGRGEGGRAEQCPPAVVYQDGAPGRIGGTCGRPDPFGDRAAPPAYGRGGHARLGNSALTPPSFDRFQRGEAGAILTAQTLNSGMREIGSRTSETAALTPAAPGKWNGENTVSGRMSAVSRAAAV